MKIAVDWSYKSEKLAVYDGKKLRKSVPKLKPGDKVYVENLPAKYAQTWLRNGIEIYRCRPNDTAEFRNRLNMPKTDSLDALFIWKLANEYPELFRRWKGDPILFSLYKMFKEVQKDRIRQSNRVWAKEEPIAEGVLHDLEAIEKKISRAMKEELEKYQIWSWLQQIKGINVVTAAGLVAFIDKIGIENLKQVSSLWHYFGVHVEDGVAARAKRGTAMSYNPDAKTLVLGIIADNFIRQRTPLYREIYDNEKKRQLNKIYKPGELAAKWHGYKASDVRVSQGHAHNRAKRKMIKVFLSHLWEVWRRMEDLPVRQPYPIEYLGHTTYIEPPFMPEELK